MAEGNSRLLEAKAALIKQRTNPEPGSFGHSSVKGTTTPASFHTRTNVYEKGKPPVPLKDGHEFQNASRAKTYKDLTKKEFLCEAASKQRLQVLNGYQEALASYGNGIAPHEAAIERVRTHSRHRHNPELQSSLARGGRIRNTLLAEE